MLNMARDTGGAVQQVRGTELGDLTCHWPWNLRTYQAILCT